MEKLNEPEPEPLFRPKAQKLFAVTEEGSTGRSNCTTIFESILRRESDDPDGLNGFLLLLHLGAGPGRKDKFHPRVGVLVDRLMEKGYRFVRVDALLDR